ncbi:ARM repeat superfamily protein [Raphanus sativus]|nr:ARM repeat superfamily protein [Raphanus sativus]KAJ4873584.1 ARM repeat superfamily protein [Raphanus sativus]KAJ4873864.1 ARM repeat superfamily protein [Raphanus sativus]
MMKGNQKAKPHAPPRPLFSFGFFRRCTQSVLSSTSPHKKPLRKPTTTASSSSTSTSQSFTQWRFPHHVDQTPSTVTLPSPPSAPLPELHLASVSEFDKFLAQLLKRVLVPDPPSEYVTKILLALCPERWWKLRWD